MAAYKLRCPACGREEPMPPQHCGECGAVMSIRRQHYSMPRWVVILLLFAVLGPFALGILWRNDRFSTGAKWVLTLLVLACTAVVVWVVYAVLQQVSHQVDEIMGQIPNF